MSAVATPAGAVPNTAVDWHAMNWPKVYRTVRRLQARIVKAVREGKWHKVKALVYLLLLWALFLLTNPQRRQAVACFPIVEPRCLNPP
jgi:hypothetical protein